MEDLIDRLLPALTAKLASTRLGELEVREGDWRIRLRRPASAGSWNGELRRAADKPARSQPGHEAHGHPRAAVEPHPGSTNGTGGRGGHAPVHAPARGGTRATGEDDPGRRIARSPAVGVFAPGSRAAVGSRVREGDTIGHVDVLGVAQEVLAPADGLVGEVLVEAGTAVEYGQELVLIQVPAAAEAR